MMSRGNIVAKGLIAAS